jgi:hypothetical protein
VTGGPVPPGTAGPPSPAGATFPPGIRPQVRAQRGRRPDPAEQHAHRAVPQQVHVIDAVHARGHPADQAPDLHLRVDPARPARPDMLCDQAAEPGTPGQGHHRHQAGMRHQIRVIERCVHLPQSMQQSHLTGALPDSAAEASQLLSSQFRGHLSRCHTPQIPN